jgi:outer membrane biosynthesis protein TonB
MSLRPRSRRGPLLLVAAAAVGVGAAVALLSGPPKQAASPIPKMVVTVGETPRAAAPPAAAAPVPAKVVPIESPPPALPERPQAGPAAQRPAAGHASARAAVARPEPARAPRRKKAPARRKVAAKAAAPVKAAAPHGDPREAYERGNRLLFAGDLPGATAAYREAVELAPNDPIGYRGLGLARAQQGEMAGAIRALRRYLKLAPEARDRALIARRIQLLGGSASHK